jgi:hypothetical protein
MRSTWWGRCRRAGRTARTSGPGPRSATRSSTRAPLTLAVSSGGDPVGEYRSASAVSVRDDPFPTGGSAITPASPGGRSTRTERAGGPRPASAHPMISCRSAERGNTDPCAGLRPGHVQQAGSQPGQQIRRLPGDGQQLVLIGPTLAAGLRAQAADRRQQQHLPPVDFPGRAGAHRSPTARTRSSPIKAMTVQRS